MIRYIERLYNFWHNTVLLFIYHVLDVYFARERVKEMVLRIALFITITIVSILLYFALTRWIPGSKNALDFTAKQPENDTQPSEAVQVQSEPSQPIPVEKDISY